jgi:hypothetical protein
MGKSPTRPVMTHRPNPGAHLKHVLPQFDLPLRTETKPPAQKEIIVNAFDERRGGYSLMSLNKQRLQEFMNKKLLQFQDKGVPMPEHIREFLES